MQTREQKDSEESGAETESRARTKYQRTSLAAGDNDSLSFRKPTAPASASRTAPGDSKMPSLAQRRKSTLKENRAPLLGPRPFESPNKGKRFDVWPKMKELALKQSRIVSDSNAAASLQARRTFLPNSTSEPVLDKTAGSKDSRFSFGETENANSPTPPAFDFLPPINFDDFQNTIARYDSPKSNQAFRTTPAVPPSIKASINSRPQPMTITQREASVPNLNNTNTSSFIPSNQLQTSASTSVLPVRARRGSQSGPGAPATGITARVTRKPMAPPSDKKLQSNLSRTPSLNTHARKPVANAVPPAPSDISFAAPTRSSKAKSLQPLPRSATLTDLPQPEQRRSVNVKVTTRSKTPRSDTPSDKRKSGRMSGLGARTISPTDARRLRRMSTKQTPSSPTKDVSQARAPSATPRRAALTPSSTRGTPDTTYKMAPPPTLNLSRTSSYQSLRAPSAGGGRIGQSASASKLPTPKPRSLYSAADRRDDEEMVPPVPAIPKAYESPKDLVDIPFFSGLKPSVTGTSDHESSALPVPSSRRENTSTTPSSDSRQHRRGLTIGNGANSETPPAVPAVNKKSLQPLRLPPLNLLPLSTPTAARINSFSTTNNDVDDRGSTPPFKRNAAKTPSTPMTASKATFYRRHDDEPSVPLNLRSSSTQLGARVPRFEEPDNGVPLPPASPGKRQAITPFTSGSLPKPSSKFTKPPRLPDEFTLGNHDAEPLSSSKPLGPRPRTVSKSVKETPSITTVSSTEDQEQPPAAAPPSASAATGLRRKLSLGWRKTPPKTTNTSNSEPLKVQTKPEEMPPPKMPASATWSADSPISGSSSGRPSIESTRFEGHRSKPSVSAPTKMAHLESAPAVKPPTSNLAFRQPQVSAAPAAQGQRSTSWSILGSMNRTLGSRNAPPPAKPKTINALHLDRDDVAANDEMRKLSTKRRDIDVAARETEELRKRASPKERLSPAQAIQASAALLNIYEKGEIIDYKDGVWFCGSKHAKKHVGDISAAGTTNFGYDDDRGDYNIVMGDHLGYRYEVVDVLGKGSFGQVVRCIDHKLGILCAVKIIRNKKRFHQQALVEVNILQKLKEWDPDEANATLTVTSSFYFRNHLCITSPCLSINLYEFIRTHNFSGFSLQLIRRFARQILACLCLLQSKKIIHCDLKPENILLCDPRRADVRVIDFGSSCKADEKVYTYIQSRFYRSPEVILGSDYGLGIDMWSYGCILAELFTGYPIFPGENEQEQLACIMEIFGPPARDIIEKASRRKLFFDSSLKPRVTVSSKGRRRRPSSKSLNTALKCDDEAFLDFLTQCLRWDPEKRLRPDQAVLHPFITNEPFRRSGPVSSRTRNATSATSSATTTTSQSPVKRSQPTNSSVPTSTSQASASTPRARPLPDTPNTAARNGNVSSNANSALLNSATKNISGNRRQSLAPNVHTASAPTVSTSHNQAMAGSKRASNGALLAQHYQQQMASYGSLGASGSSTSSSGLPRSVSGKLDLAGAAARESMGATARWR